MGHDVVCVGTLNVDLIVRGEAPRELPRLLEWVDAAEVELLAAGSVGYFAVDCARLGLKVSMLSTVADDLLGQVVLEALRREGVETGGVELAAGERSGIGIYLLLFGSSKRPLTGRRSSHPPWPAQLSTVARERLRAARLLHCGGYLHYPQMRGEPAERLFREAKSLGLITTLDPQFPFQPVEGKWLPLFGDLLKSVDVLLTDELEAAAITGIDELEAAAQALLDQGPGLVVIKQGAEGAILATKDRLLHQPVMPIDLIADSIGAGDAFDAGVVHGLLQKWPLEPTARFAAAVAALTLRGMGGTQTAPSLVEVQDFLARARPASGRKT